MSTTWAWAVTAVLAGTDWYAVARGARRLEGWAKPATLIALIVTAVALDAGETGAGRWLLAALAFGLLGDVFLLEKTSARFRAGLAAFLVGHLAYLVGFAEFGLSRPAWAFAGAVVALAALGYARAVLPATHRSGGPALSAPVAAYMLVISAMVVLAWATGDAVVALGATVFVASDAMLAVNRFVRPFPGAGVAVMVTYHVGQALIVLGLLG